MGIFDFLRRRGGGNARFQGEQAAALKKFKLDPGTQNINHVDIKTGYAMGTLAGDTYFQHISSHDPKAIRAVGLDPALRDEVNFNSIKGKTKAFQGTGGSGPSFRFIFAFMCDGRDDTRLSKALNNLGWLQPPADGGVKYLYVFRQGSGTEYFSAGGILNKSSEVMFPHRIGPDAIETIYTLTWTGASGRPAVTRYAALSMGSHRGA